MSRILVIEDNPDNLALMTYLLRAFEHEVLTAKDGERGIAAARREAVDLIVCDVHLPGKDGYAVAAELKADPGRKSVPLIAVTALAMVGDREGLLAAGFDGYIAKPIDPERFVPQVEAFLPPRGEAGGAAGAPEPDIGQAEADAESIAAPVRARILVVDDHVINREFLATLLGYAGHTVLQAADGKQALEAARAEHPDLVISDVLMPTMSGIEFANALHADESIAGIPIIFHTATYRLNEARQLADDCGVSAVLAKPCEPREVLEAVAAVLGIAAPAPAAPIELSESLTEKLPAYLRELSELQQRLQSALEMGFELAGDGRALRQTSDRLVSSFATVQGLSMRLAALLELGMALCSEHEPDALIDMFCRAAQNIMSARYVGVGILDRENRRLQAWASRGAAGELGEDIAGIDPHAGILGEVLASDEPRHLCAIGGDPESLGLPKGHPPVRELLAVPIHSTTTLRGWLYVADKLGDGTFNEEDEQFAVTLAAQVALTYERLVQHDEIQQHAARLELEITERKRAAEELRASEAQLREQHEKVQRLTRIYAVLSEINSAIVRIHDRDKLLDEACRIAVAEGTFRMAWIAAFDKKSRKGRVVASRGASPDYLAKVRLDAGPGAPHSRRPAIRAVLEKKPVICNDVAADPDWGAMGPVLLGEGAHAVAAFPLLVDGEAVAVLSLFAGETGFFDERELALLNELAGDIAFGLQYIEKEEQLSYLAYYDALTGLPNTTLFHDRLSQFLHAAAYNRKGAVAVILLDLDKFTQINDTLGRHVGDLLLCAVGERMRKMLPEPYGLARINADLYAIALADLANGTEAAIVLRDRIFHALRQPFVVEGREIRLSAKAGIALYPGDGDDTDDLFKNAEAALKHAQSSGEEFLYYAPEINASAAETLALEGKLRKAVEQKQFVLHYQPIYDVKSGAVSGLEALIRWRDPDNGMIEPAKFVPVLEQTGLILNVGAWVLKQTLADYRHWRDRGLKPPRIAVNVSPIQLRRGRFTGIVRRAIDDSGVGGQALEIEITEGLLMENAEAHSRTLHDLREMGVKIAVDDFGTGYSSLRYLAKLPVDTLKIDRSFIATMADDADSMTIVSTVISLAHSLNLTVVAEGVDAEEQAKFLRLMKCDQMQGYLFSKPIPADAVETLLSQP